MSGRASPSCSDRYSRTLPRATETNQGKPGSNWCSHSLTNPSRAYYATAGHTSHSGSATPRGDAEAVAVRVDDVAFPSGEAVLFNGDSELRRHSVDVLDV